MRERQPKKESKPDAPKSVPKSISLPPDMLADVEKVVASKHGGNLSRYIQSLIERDLAEAKPAPSEGADEGIIEAIAKCWRPDIAGEISQSLSELKCKSQRRLLGELLSGFNIYLLDLLAWGLDVNDLANGPLVEPHSSWNSEQEHSAWLDGLVTTLLFRGRLPEFEHALKRAGGPFATWKMKECWSLGGIWPEMPPGARLLQPDEEESRYQRVIAWRMWEMRNRKPGIPSNTYPDDVLNGPSAIFSNEKNGAPSTKPVESPKKKTGSLKPVSGGNPAKPDPALRPDSTNGHDSKTA